MSAPARLHIGHCACGALWCGEDICHCASCHATFATVALFESHRRRGLCKRPAELGLVKTSGVWELPPLPVADRRARWAALRARDGASTRTPL